MHHWPRKQILRRSSHDRRSGAAPAVHSEIVLSALDLRPLPKGLSLGSTKGQTMTEFALVLPALLLLLSGMLLAGFYAFRAAAADWGTFITGVSAGAYPAPADDQARLSVAWPDIRDRLTVELDANSRQARSRITVQDTHSWMFGLELVEAQRGTSVFRLWRFYPGPPAPGGVE
jgi:hypothetical protein